MRWTRARSLALLLILTAATMSSGCTTRKAVADVGPLAVGAQAYPSPTPGAGSVAVGAPQDIQALTIWIQGGRFDADVYTAQARPIRITVWADDSTDTLAIDGLLDPQPLTAGAPTIIGVTLPNPGRYTMRVGGAGSGTAVLDVHAAGTR
jgi:hypothetical protein